MKVKYYARFLCWLPKAFLRELDYRFCYGRKSTHIWRDCNGNLLGPKMNAQEHYRWF